MSKRISKNGRQVVGLGDDGSLRSPMVAQPSPWAVAITTSMVGAAVGWVIEEIATHVRGRRK